MFPLDSGIRLSLTVEAGHVSGVGIESTRMVQAARMLVGRRPDQAVAILPAIFALCGTAQALAGAAAIEDAAGLAPAAPQARARRLLLLVETVIEHAAGILRDWPALVGLPPDIAAIRPLRPLLTAFRLALYPDGDWARPGGGRLVVDRAVLAGLLSGLAALRGRIEREGAEADTLLRHVEQAGLAGFGAGDIRPMPAAGPDDLARRLADDHDGAYVGRPDCDGLVPETGAFARRLGHPAVAGRIARHGAGLAARLAARLTEVAESLREVEDLAQNLAGHAAPGLDGRISGNGLGRVDAARGLLVHRVELEEGVVRRYQILAPTEWNFHPRGVLRQGLLGREAGPGLEAAARLLVAALDPCVACTVEVAGNA